MRRESLLDSDPEDLKTWAKYKAKLCRHCTAACCRLPVETRSFDLVRLGLIDDFSLSEDQKYIARDLMKKGIIEHFHAKTKMFTLSRHANGDCIFLDQQSRTCTRYDERPDTCRNHPIIGPRPGYCPYQAKK